MCYNDNLVDMVICTAFDKITNAFLLKYTLFFYTNTTYTNELFT